jgi:hypothetical protein
VVRLTITSGRLVEDLAAAAEVRDVSAGGVPARLYRPAADARPISGGFSAADQAGLLAVAADGVAADCGGA